MPATDPRLLLPATRALLEGWSGPVVVAESPERWLAFGDLSLGQRTQRTDVVLTDGSGTYWKPMGRVSLDLSRAECRDRVARVVAASRWPMQVQSTALRWGTRIPEERAWVLGGAWVYTSCVEEPDEVLVPALADLDPTDDTRLPDGSRWVDAAALAAVARHVLGGPDAR